MKQNEITFLELIISLKMNTSNSTVSSSILSQTPASSP